VLRTMNKFLTVLSIFCYSSLGIAQDNTINNESNESQISPILLSYISLTSSFEIYNSIDFGLMQSVGKTNAIGGEIGYIYNLEGFNQSIQENWYSDIYGVKTYFYYRFYLNFKNDYPNNSKTFFDVEPQFYWVSFKAERIAGYSCNDEFGDCEYYRFYDSRVDRIVPGLNIKIGKIYNYDPFYITIFAGLGYRHVIEYSEMNNNSVLPDKIFNTRGEISDLQTGGQVKLRLGVQLAYNLWGKN